MTRFGQTRPLSTSDLQAAFERAVDGAAPPIRTAAPPPAAMPALAAKGPLDIERLMALDDRAFVEAAYGGILHRAPDEAGIDYHLRQLASGRSRILVLGALRNSPEGQAVGTPVPGLQRRFLLHRIYQVPVLGRLVRTVTGVAALPGLVRDTNRLWAEVHALRAEGQAAAAASEQAARQSAERAEQEAGLARQRAAGAERSVERLRDQVQASLQQVAGRVDQVSQRAQEEPWADPLLALAEQLEAQAERLRGIDAQLGTAEEARTVGAAGRALAALGEALGLPREPPAFAARVAALLGEHRNIAVRAISAADDTRALLRDQERRLSLILADVRTWMAAGASVEEVDAHQQSLLDPLYLEFEDRFRGSRADIKARQAVYLDDLRRAGAGTVERPVVDVGSGRGELLELLRESGLEAGGVDLNEAMVGTCQKAGLRCVHGDAVAYLSGLEPGSLGAVTGFHIIEHLPFPVLIGLFDASLRALAPGGVVIFETPNPANLLVASRWFHLDPTHRNPLPGEMVAMFAEARGFVDVSVRPLHPMQARFEARDEVLAGQLDAIFHGPQDYALIARKP